jgi:hypothetical protein
MTGNLVILLIVLIIKYIVVSTYVTIKILTYQLTDNQLGSNPIQNFFVILVRLLINYYEIINLISTRFQPGFNPILTSHPLLLSHIVNIKSNIKSNVSLSS